MTGKIRTRLFLTNSENETILELADAILDSDFDTEVEMALGQKWARLLYSIVFGKVINGTPIYPVILQRDRNESTD